MQLLSGRFSFLFPVNEKVVDHWRASGSPHDAESSRESCRKLSNACKPLANQPQSPSQTPITCSITQLAIEKNDGNPARNDKEACFDGTQSHEKTGEPKLDTSQPLCVSGAHHR